MPEHMRFRPHKELLQDEELLTIVQAAASLGVDKIRLTGGEPTIRPGLVNLVRAIASTPGIRQLTMTTNGILLPQLAKPLAQAGLQRVNISLDTLNPEKFHRITRWGHLDDVWAGIEAAQAAGLDPIKLNCVVVRDYNEEEVVDLARLTLEHPWEVRFIEMMPFGSVADFAQDAVISSQETMARIEAALGPLLPVPGDDGHDPARPYYLPGAQGKIGFISTITAPFCAHCGRVRLTADGKLRLCLLRDDEVDLLTPLRQGVSFDELRELLAKSMRRKPWGNGLPDGIIPQARVMSQIGG